MIAPEEHSPGSDPTPHVAVSKKKGFSLIWVVPIVAVLIGAGLAYKAVTEKGPVVTITFASAEGLEAGKTKVKYKDLEVGQVESIELNKDRSHIMVTVQMVKRAEDYLTEDARFWVVRPRLAGGVITGLGTILSGAYIAVEPGKAGAAVRHFKGLEVPPVISADVPGRHFLLQAAQIGSLDYGSPIYFRGIKVGQVVGYNLGEQGDSVNIRIFIEAPYDQNVHLNSRFWFVSGLDVDLSAQGIRIDTQSFVSMMIGGISFSNPDHLEQSPMAKEGKAFPLYDTRRDAIAERFALKDYYLLKFNQSVRGLSVGAPVEFRGFPIGKVVDINVEFDWAHETVYMPVKIEVEPERLRKFSVRNDAPENALKILVEQGLRAQMRTGNLLTGQLYIAVDFFPAAKPATLVVHKDIIEIPTIPTPLEKLTGSITALLEKLQKLPVEQIGEETVEAIRSINETSRSIKTLASSQTIRDTAENLNKVSKQAVDTLAEIDQLVGSDSPVVFELKRALKEISEAAHALRILAERLERHPESLLKGKGGE